MTKDRLRPTKFAGMATATALAALAAAARAGPPYLSDDPEPTDYRHFEIYAFDNGKATRSDTSGEAGIDFNYGAAPDLQLTAVLPAGYDSAGGMTTIALGNIELAAKYRFLHQETNGIDASIFPRVFLPSGAVAVGPTHASFFLPIWLEKDWGPWSVFGGGGCEFNRSGNSLNFCQVGSVLARQVLPDLQLGFELFHQTPDTKGSGATTSIGVGIRYDVSDTYHLLAYGGPGIQNAAATDLFSWYAAMLFTF
jgi:hypothetical protein